MTKKRSPLRDMQSLSPDDMAKLLELVARTPAGDVRQAALAEGFPMHAIDKFLRNMRTTHVGVAEAVKSLGHNDMVALLTEKMSLALGKIDAGKLDASNARDIAIVFGILAEKRELLQGKPTQIFSFEERKSMKELLPGALREAARRGFTVDASAVEVEFQPRVISGDIVLEETINRTARSEAVKKLPVERQ